MRKRTVAAMIRVIRQECASQGEVAAAKHLQSALHELLGRSGRSSLSGYRKLRAVIAMAGPDVPADLWVEERVSAAQIMGWWHEDNASACDDATGDQVKANADAALRISNRGHSRLGVVRAIVSAKKADDEWTVLRIAENLQSFEEE